MAKTKLVIGTPHNKIFTHQYVTCITGTYYDLSPKYDINTILSESCLIHANRNQLIILSEQEKTDFLILIDSDMVWTSEDIDTLVSLNKEVSVGVCCTRHRIEGRVRVPIMRYDESRHLQNIVSPPMSPFKCDAAGAAFMAIRGDVLTRLVEAIPKIGFPFDYMKREHFNEGEKPITNLLGEDLSFCKRLEKLGVKIWCHPHVRIGHVGERVLQVTNG